MMDFIDLSLKRNEQDMITLTKLKSQLPEDMHNMYQTIQNNHNMFENALDNNPLL